MPTLDDIRKALADPDPEIRRRAAAAAEDATEEDVIPLVIAALGDVDWRVRKEAARVAAALSRSAAIIPALITALGMRENVGLRNAAVEALVLAGAATVGPLLGAVPAMGPDGRKFAVEVLGDIGDPRAVPTLAATLADGDPNVRAAAAEALGRAGGEAAIAALEGALEGGDLFMRLAILESLNRLGAPVPYARLQKLLGERILRHPVIVALGRCPEPQVVPVLASALTDRVRLTAAAAAESLSQIHQAGGVVADEVAARLGVATEAEVQFLTEQLAIASAPERLAAVRLLGMVRHDEALRTLLAAAADDTLTDAVASAVAPRGPTAIPVVLASIENLPHRAITPLVELLPRLCDDAHAPTVRLRLHDLCGSDDEALCAAAADALGQLGDAASIEPLFGIIDRNGPRAARSAARALGALGRRHREPVREGARQRPLQGASGPHLCAILAEVGDTEDVPRLRAALASEDAALRRAAVEAIGALGGEPAVEAVSFVLADESTEVQAAAARALGRLRAPGAIDALLATLLAAEPLVQAAAAKALGEVGDARAIDPLRNLCRSAGGVAALAALEALRKLGDNGIGEVLVEALGHSDPEVVKQALLSIHDLRDPRGAARIAVCLEHSAWDVRRLAARLLAEIGDRVAIGALEARLVRETDELVRETIAAARAVLHGAR